MRAIHRSCNENSAPEFSECCGTLALPVLTARPVQFATNSRNPLRRRSCFSQSDPVKIGFVPTIDCAVLLAAQELCLFEKHGLRVTLRKELGWATLREKLARGEFNAVHAPATLAFAMHCGIGMSSRPCLTAFVLSLNGSAITLSDKLWQRGVRDAASLRNVIAQDRPRTTYRFGAALELSSQHADLRSWLQAGGINPSSDVSIPMVPSAIIHRQLLEGHLDGYCVAEPWNSMVTQAGEGWVAATSAEIAPKQPEKVLLVLEEFAETRQDEHLAMVAALIEASVFCENPANRPALIHILAQSRYLDVPESVLANSLIGPFDTGRGKREIENFIVFHRDGANRPDREKACRVLEQVRSLSAAEGARKFRSDVIGRVFREDLYLLAAARIGGQPPAAPCAVRNRLSSEANNTVLKPPRLAFAS